MRQERYHLLETWAKALNDEILETFARWYPERMTTLSFRGEKRKDIILSGSPKLPQVQFDEKWGPIGERPLFGIHCKRVGHFASARPFAINREIFLA